MLTDNTRESRNVKYAVMFLKTKICIACFLPRQLGKDIINSMVTRAHSRARPHLASPDSYVYLTHPRPLHWALIICQSLWKRPHALSKEFQYVLNFSYTRD